MHILFVTGEYPPMSGGVGAYTAALADALGDAGVEATVLTSVRAQPAPEGRVTVHPSIRRWDLCACRKLLNLAQTVHADWVHVQYQTAAFAMNPIINLATPRNPTTPVRPGGSSVAWTYHDLLPPYLFPKAGVRLRNWITERPAGRADLVIVTNEADRLHLAGHANNLHAIPIGSNIAGVQLDDAARTALRARDGYAADDLLLGYFGFLNRNKGGETLIAALATLVAQGINAHLLMIGDRVGASDPTNAATLAEIEALISSNGLASRVRWTGRLDDAAAGAALNEIDLLLLPYSDGASLRRGTLMAGLANGCAIITTRPTLAIAELVDGRDIIYVPPGNASALAVAAAALAADPERVARMRMAARTRSTLFTWAAIADAHLALYRANRPGAPQP